MKKIYYSQMVKVDRINNKTGDYHVTDNDF
jgi:hypothetical protein